MTDPVAIGILLAAAAIVVVVAFLLFVRSPARRHPPEGMGAALLALASHEPDRAREILTRAVREEESSPEAFLVLGRLMREAGEAERAAGLHRSLLARPRLDPANRLAAEIELGRDLLLLGRHDEVTTRIAELESHYQDARIADLHARSHVASGRLEAAAEVWDQHLRQEKDPAVRARGTAFLGEVAREYLRQGQRETAERWARQALRADEDSALAEVVLGDVERGRDNPRKTREHYESAIRHGGAQWVLPRLLDHALEQGQMETLLDLLEPARAEQPRDLALSRAVLDLRLRRGDREEFFALLESEDLPGFRNPEIWSGWIRHLLAAGDEDGLRRVLDRLPETFGSREWRCPECGAIDHEPRAACLACGAPEALQTPASVERSS